MEQMSTWEMLLLGAVVVMVLVLAWARGQGIAGTEPQG